MTLVFEESGFWRASLRRLTLLPDMQANLSAWAREEAERLLMIGGGEEGSSATHRFYCTHLGKSDLLLFFTQSLEKPEKIFLGKIEVDPAWNPP